MKKSVIALITAATLCASAFGSLVGCDGNRYNNRNDGDDDIYPPSASNFVISGDSATVRWEECDDATGYLIAAAPSRHADYEEIEFIDGGSKTSCRVDDIDAYYKVTAVLSDGSTEEVGVYSYETELFGRETHIYAPTDKVELIQADFDEFYEMTYDESNGVKRGEFRSERFAALFKPGAYDISADVGYYTALYGLGDKPDDVTLTAMNVTSNVSLCNFWRTAENLAVNNDVTWAVSQATSLRRVHLKKSLALSYPGGSTSGGFLANVKVDGSVNQGSQQQWLTRNSNLGGWSGNVWNTMFVGVEFANEQTKPQDKWLGTGNNYTVIDSSGTFREKPYIVYDETDGYGVFVPDAEVGAVGVDFIYAAGVPGRLIPIDEFYVARSDRDTAATINAALKNGKHILFSAGIYDIDTPLTVNNADTVILGLGLATLRASDTNTDSIMRIGDVDGVCVGGLLFDAGRNKAECLLEVGETASATVGFNPITLSDLFFRVGGWTYDGAAVETCVIVNADGVIGDNLWIWRADHSDMPYQVDTRTLYEGVGWDINPSDTGIIVNGDDATFYGLFVEHFNKYQTVFNGNGCTTYFYQSELPYDVPSADEWTPDGSINGYASYYVADTVTSHTAYSLGVYSFLRDAAVTLDSAIICPETDGVSFNHMVTVWLNGNDDTAISGIVNGTGGAAMNGSNIKILASYPS